MFILFFITFIGIIFFVLQSVGLYFLMKKEYSNIFIKYLINESNQKQLNTTQNIQNIQKILFLKILFLFFISSFGTIEYFYFISLKVPFMICLLLSNFIFDKWIAKII